MNITEFRKANYPNESDRKIIQAYAQFRNWRQMRIGKSERWTYVDSTTGYRRYHIDVVYGQTVNDTEVVTHVEKRASNLASWSASTTFGVFSDELLAVVGIMLDGTE